MMQIQGIGLALPGSPIKQTDLLQLAQRFNATTRAERIRLERIYRGTKVAHRYSVLSQPGDDSQQAMQGLDSFYDKPADAAGPTTSHRMQRYEQEAIHLAAEACRNALNDSDCDPQAITHLITVSCTGFSAPGLDSLLIDLLGLDTAVSRTHVGFMGCHGALNGMRVADAFASSDPEARVLLCCVELCTLHFQYGSDPQDAVANALFGDGAAALVGGGEAGGQAMPSIASFRSLRLPDTGDMMSWRIGDEGFRMRLSSQVPEQVQRTLKPLVTDWLSSQRRSISDVAGWVIHPGGPKVIDGVAASLGLTDEQTRISREVLRDCGNMSSPTVLFIADRLRRAGIAPPWVMVGFGPGLAIEACLIQ